jgi:alkylation response protein AidB-like acyl-CoA dehydrogenase
MRFGNAEQQRSHLPPIANGDVIWCQGFSEPEAGSDLAAIRTRAKPSDNGWQITGQKVWTSYATMAQWCVIAARTSVEQRRQDGLTVFLLPMDRPGIRVRPIASMLGPHHLNELFLDQVPVNTSDVLGEAGDGWTVMREALAYERVGIARYARCERLLSELPRHPAHSEILRNPILEGRWLQALLAARTARLLAYWAIHEQSRGVVNDMTSSAARVAITTADQFVGDVLADALGPEVLAPEGTGDDWFRAAVEDHWRYSQAATVSSGTLEIQLLLVARSVLGQLPL